MGENHVSYIKIIITLLAFTQISLSYGTTIEIEDEKVVYGDDNREDVQDVKSFYWRAMADTTAAMVLTKKLGKAQNGVIKIIENSIQETWKLCPSERFSAQKNPGNCTGFLLSGNLLITAGHCLRRSTSCNNYKWVFGMYQQEGTSELEVPENHVFGCKRIIHHAENRLTKEDWGIVELDRKAEGFPHVQINTESEINIGEEVVVIGNPSGLPTKVAGDAYVRKNDHENFFVASLDTFGGNSGSPVFNAKTGLVEGILVRGEADYVVSSENGVKCRRVKKCNMDDCRGEDVSRISSFIKMLHNGDY